ncbi:MAG: sigma-70 family RNA polymerase sigma factor, partial [Actinobacteria bacterium]|nr:sigma-70 family RNA polymerase sigma factor [Actinomycetota bacterium]
MRRSPVRRRSLVAEHDGDLAHAAAAGGAEAFTELYRRHAGAAWGVANAILRNRDDAADAVAEAFTNVFRALSSSGDDFAGLRFRPYLLTATRNAAIDMVRATAHAPSADLDGDVIESKGRGPVEEVVAREDSALVTEAFAELPERWRSALWLIDVEQLSTREAASILGVEPNNAAQLAARARSRLRAHYVQAHVPNHIQPVCRDVVASLGSYLARTASPTARARVDHHVAECSDCSARLAHVRDLGITLRRALLPLPLVLHERVRRMLETVGGSRASAFAAQVGGAPVVSTSLPVEGWAAVVQHLSAASPMFERVVAGTSAAVLAVAVSAMATKSPDPSRPEARRAPASAAASPGQVAPAGPLARTSPVAAISDRAEPPSSATNGAPPPLPVAGAALPAAPGLLPNV